MDNHHVGLEPRLGGAERTILIEAAITDVFDLLADGCRATSWLAWVSKSELGEFGGGVGATYRQVVADTALGQPDFCYRVMHHRRPVMLGIEAVSLVPHPTATYRLTALEPTSTAVTLTGVVPGSDAADPDRTAAQHWVELLLEGLTALKVYLEGESGSP